MIFYIHQTQAEKSVLVIFTLKISKKQSRAFVYLLKAKWKYILEPLR